MSGEVPDMFWFLFWIFLALLCAWMAWQGGKSAHEQRMRALDIMKMYAEKGIEPPASLNDPNFTPTSPPAPPTPGSKRWKTPKTFDELMHKFGSSVFFAGVMGGLAWWRIDVGGPQWAIYVTVILAIVSGVGAVGSLIGAVATAVAGAIANHPGTGDDGRG